MYIYYISWIQAKYELLYGKEVLKDIFWFIYLFIFYKFIYFIFIYFWLRWVFVAAGGLSLVAASGGYSSLRWLPLLRSTGSRAQAQQLWRMGLVAPWHVGSSQTRAQTCVPCTGRRILDRCATREAQTFSLLLKPSTIRTLTVVFLARLSSALYSKYKE